MIEYEYFTFLDGSRRRYLPSKKFDRKTFDPHKSETDRAILKTLRTTGRTRYEYLRINNISYPSSSMRYLMETDTEFRSEINKGEGYIDFGCGESGDRFIAHRLGYNSVGMDLFPPLFVEQETESPAFITGDIAEPLPFPDHSFTYATCHAVIDLLPPRERAGFYKEVYRCLKIGGTFVLTGVELKNGYGFDTQIERERLLKSAEFDYERAVGFGTVVKRN
jgi:SAM-dependent methyltransferase